MKIAIVGSALAKEFKQFHQIYFYCSSSIKYMFKQIVLVTSIIIFWGCGTDNNNSEIFYIDYYQQHAMSWESPNYDLTFRIMQNQKLINNTQEPVYFEDKNRKSIDLNYSWGYIYMIRGCDLGCVDAICFQLDDIISKEKHFEPFTITVFTYTSDYKYTNENNETVTENGESLINRLSEDTFIVYDKLEFKIYNSILINKLDEAMKNDKVTLTFDFEDNGTIFLQSINPLI